MTLNEITLKIPLFLFSSKQVKAEFEKKSFYGRFGKRVENDYHITRSSKQGVLLIIAF